MRRPGLAALAWSNLARRPVRNGILVLCAAAVVGLQLAAAVLDRASQTGLRLGMERLGADLVVVPRGLDLDVERAYITGEAALFYMDVSILSRIKAFPFVAQASPQLYLQSLAGASCCSAWNIFLIGFDPATDFTVRPWLTDRPDRRVGPDQVLLGAALEAPAGTRMKFFGHEFTVAGTLSSSGMGLDLTVFIPLDTAYRMAEDSGRLAQRKLEISRGRISAVMVRLRPEGEGGVGAAKAAFKLEQGLPEVTVIQPEDMTVMVRENLGRTLGALRSVSYAVWPVAALLAGLVFSMAAHERRRELGLLRAMGASRGFVFRLVLAEAVIVTGLGGAVGTGVSLGLTAGFSRLVARTLAVPFAWPGPGEVLGVAAAALGLAMATGAAAAWWPAWRSSRMEPYEAVRRGE